MPATSTNLTGAVEVARSFFAAYNAHDVGRMVAACSEDARLRYVPMGDHGHGKVREVGQAIWSGLIDAFPALAVPALGLPFIVAGTLKIVYDVAIWSVFRHVQPPEEASRRRASPTA